MVFDCLQGHEIAPILVAKRPGKGSGTQVIVYGLRCEHSHEFEGWFKDGAAYDQQAADGKLVCPICETHRVSKAPMAPAVAGTKKQDVSSPNELRRMRQFMTGLRKYVQENAEYVGPRFPEEARKIHYDEVPPRAIRGQASAEEAQSLREEGIEFASLPPFLTNEQH